MKINRLLFMGFLSKPSPVAISEVGGNVLARVVKNTGSRGYCEVVNQSAKFY
jgi:hypothetical protein